MKFLRVFLTAAFVLATSPQLKAQGQQRPSDVPKINVTSNLVFLDVTVLDKKGRPVVSGLSEEDFTITEDNAPQRIFSFEAPESHVSDPNAGDSNASGTAPVTILVMDLLNSSFEDFAYIRYEVRQFLKAQPEKLATSTELIVVGNTSLEMLQGFTRSRTDLLYALRHLPAELPWKKMNNGFGWDRFRQSLDALQQIALQNKGVPGRKNIIWVGHGGPGLYLDSPTFSGKLGEDLKQYVHSTTNMLVDARLSLFVIYPGLPITGGVTSISAMQSEIELGDDDPFAGDINFGVFANETGGKLFYNHNNVDAQIKRSENIGANFYTLTYQPQEVEANGKFRRIRVKLRDANLHVVTKAGYFAPDKNSPIDPRQDKMNKLAEAIRAAVPFNALEVSLSDIVRHPDSQTVEFTVQLKSKNVAFQPADNDGKRDAKLILAAASLNEDARIVTSKVETVTLLAHDAARLPEVASRFQLTIRIPRKTKRVRVVMEDQDGGRIGAADLDRKTIAAAPATETPLPELRRRPPDSQHATP
jgi:VWFA-related protein